jgi:hypothetical protein
MRTKTTYFILFCSFLALLVSSSCTRTAFSPIWYSVSPPAVHDFQEKGEWHGSFQYIDADNGGGMSASVMHSPVKHLIVGAGAGTLGNKGVFSLLEETNGVSRHTQGDIMGGGYLPVWRNFVSLQCMTGFSYGSTYSRTLSGKVFTAAYQKLYLQPTLLLRLPNQMSLDVSVRQSQLNFTSAKVVIGGVPDQEVATARLVQQNTPLKLREVHVGYSYGNLGPISIGITYSVNTISKASMLGNLSYEAITIPVRVNIQEFRKAQKARKTSITQG